MNKCPHCGCGFVIRDVKIIATGRQLCSFTLGEVLDLPAILEAPGWITLEDWGRCYQCGKSIRMSPEGFPIKVAYLYEGKAE